MTASLWTTCVLTAWTMAAAITPATAETVPTAPIPAVPAAKPPTPPSWLERHQASINAALQEDHRVAIARWAEEARRQGLEAEARRLLEVLAGRTQAETLAAQAEAAVAAGDIDLARRQWQEALRLWPEWPRAEQGLATVLRMPVERHLARSDAALQNGCPLAALLHAFAAEAACPKTETALTGRIAARMAEAAAAVDAGQEKRTLTFSGDPQLPGLGTALVQALGEKFPRLGIVEAKEGAATATLRLSAQVLALTVETRPAGMATKNIAYGQASVPVPNPAYAAIQQRIASLERERDGILANYPRFRQWYPPMFIQAPAPKREAGGEMPGRPASGAEAILRNDPPTVIFIPGRSYSDRWLTNRLETINQTLQQLYNLLQNTPTTVKEQSHQNYTYQANRFLRTGLVDVEVRFSEGDAQRGERHVTEKRFRSDETWLGYPPAGLAEKNLSMPAEEEDRQRLAAIALAGTANAAVEMLEEWWDERWRSCTATADPDRRLEAQARLVLECPALSLRLDSLLRKEWKSVPPHLWKRVNEKIARPQAAKTAEPPTQSPAPARPPAP